MGIYSTMEISRVRALRTIKKELKNLDTMSNEELAEFLFIFVGDKWGANFIVSEETIEED